MVRRPQFKRKGWLESHPKYCQKCTGQSGDKDRVPGIGSGVLSRMGDTALHLLVENRGPKGAGINDLDAISCAPE